MDDYCPGTARKGTKVYVSKKKTRYYLGDRKDYRQNYLRSEHWVNLKQEKLKLNPQCEQCQSPEHLDVHHVNYRNLYDVTVQDLKTLCRKCHTHLHNEQHKQPKRAKKKSKIPYRHRAKLVKKMCAEYDLPADIVEFHIDQLVAQKKLIV